MIKEPQSPFIEIDENFVEEWIPVVDERIKPDIYEVSTAGRVRNKNRDLIGNVKRKIAWRRISDKYF